MTRYCVHGQTACTGDPYRGLPPCLPSEHVYCSHGVDTRRPTKEGTPHCPYCRGSTRALRNPDTYRRRRRDTPQPALPGGTT